MGWFKRIKKGVTTETTQKKEMPEGLWYKCPKCQTIITSEDHHNQLYICENCNHIIYQGMELRYVNDVIKANSGKCEKCNKVLVKKDFKIEIKKK